MHTLTLQQNGWTSFLSFSGERNLRDLLLDMGADFASPCGGRGVCGKCRVAVRIGDQAPSVRLACRTTLAEDAFVDLGDETPGEDSDANDALHSGPVPASGQGFGAAVDIGTTTLCLRLVAPDGRYLAEVSAFNPQRAVSSDVIGRIDAALHGRGQTLQTQVQSGIRSLLTRACEKAGISADAVTSFVLTGNTTMLYLYTGRSPASIARAPFRSDTLFGEQLTDAKRRIYLPPCMDAFVGADITCAVLACGLTDSRETVLLMDIGTNGEIALWKDGRLYVTSTAAGPAFEGAEISCGCAGIEGAVDHVDVVNGAIRTHTLHDAPAKGLCGSGLIDAVAAFLNLGRIDETGAVQGELRLPAVGSDLILTAADIRAVQLAKAAIAAGLTTLLHHTKTGAEDIRTLYIAGGLGSHLLPESAVRIGLIPPALEPRVRSVGNAALAGASMLLTRPELLTRCEEIAALTEPVPLSGRADFNEAFIDAIAFPE